MNRLRIPISLFVGLAAFAAGGVLPARAAGGSESKPYVVTVNYTGAATTTATAYPALTTQEQVASEGVGSALAGPRPSDGRVAIATTDAAGRPVAAWVYFIRPGRDSYSTKLICSSTHKPLPINSEYAVAVALAAGECGSGHSAPTRGEVTFTFTKR